MRRPLLAALVVSLVAASSARAASTDPWETAHVLADGVRVTATSGTSTLCRDLGEGKRACLVADFIYPLTLHGRAPARAGRTVLVLLAAPARNLRASLGDVRSRPLAVTLRRSRINPRRWRVRLPASLPGGLDRLSFTADYGASNEVNFEAGLRVVRRAVDPHASFRFTLSGRDLLVDHRARLGPVPAGPAAGGRPGSPRRGRLRHLPARAPRDHDRRRSPSGRRAL